jgi:hypothetical protein
MKKIRLLLTFLMVISLFLFNCSKIYKLRDIGPASGFIFYDKGSYSDGWRYLEVAPVETEWKNIQWGAFFILIGGTQTKIGSGKLNTELLVKKFNDIGESNNPAQLCKNLNFNRFNDWFLPSIDEIKMIYENLYKENVGSIAKDYYWSSSEQYSNFTWYFVNYYGDINTGDKRLDFRVRAIRSF